jgi:S1-C subfamily serine protease
MTDTSDAPSRPAHFCPSCGHPQETDGTYCTDCGTQLSSADGSKTRVSGWILAAIAAAFMMIVATIAVLAFGGSDDGVAAPAHTTTTTLPATTTQAPPATMTTAPELDERELADSLGNAVFKITTDGCEIIGTGSGFAIDANHIVTNRHVVENDTTPKIVGRDGSVYDGRVVGWREDPDMAVIWVDRELDTYLEWADSDQLSEGERTVSLGYPLPDHDFSVAPGVVLSFDDERGHREAIRSDAQLDRGNSGGPTLLSDGRVAGVVTAMDLNLSGFQFVPIIIPSNDIVEKVQWILEHPSRPTVDCDEVLAALEPEAPATTTTVAPPPPPAAAPPPPQESFYTVILASLNKSNASYDQATARAYDLEIESGIPTYVLDSNGYSSLRRGYWVVYVGKLNRGDAKEYAQIFRNYGYDAYAQELTG